MTRMRAGRPEGVYHVVNRGNNRQSVFHDDRDYQYYLGLLSAYTQRHSLALRHFVLMPDHAHLLIATPAGTALSRAMLSINLRYSLFYKKRYHYSGHLWQGRFKCQAMDPQTNLVELGRYLELHPVRDGLAEDPGAYRWSSYSKNTDGSPWSTLELTRDSEQQLRTLLGNRRPGRPRKLEVRSYEP